MPDDPDPTPTEPTDDPTTDAPEPTTPVEPTQPTPSHGVLPEFDHPNANTGTATSTEIVHRWTCTRHIATTWELIDGERTRVLERWAERYPGVDCGVDGAAAGVFNPSQEG